MTTRGGCAARTTPRGPRPRSSTNPARRRSTGSTASRTSRRGGWGRWASASAAVCCYPTGLHEGKLGRDADAGSLARSREIAGRLLVVFGEADPHVPEEGRWAVAEALQAAGGDRHRVALYPGEHAFMRDEGTRFDPEASDAVWREAIDLFRSELS